MRALLSLGVLCAAQSHATSYSGTVEWLEVWPSGNSAFRLAGLTEPCNYQTFIINKSSDSAKNLYALLLTAKATAQTSCGTGIGKSVRPPRPGTR
jgi:hypothetical protein